MRDIGRCKVLPIVKTECLQYSDAEFLRKWQVMPSHFSIDNRINTAEEFSATFFSKSSFIKMQLTAGGRSLSLILLYHSLYAGASNHTPDSEVFANITPCLIRSQAEPHILVDYIPGIFRCVEEYHKITPGQTCFIPLRFRYNYKAISYQFLDTVSLKYKADFIISLPQEGKVLLNLVVKL